MLICFFCEQLGLGHLRRQLTVVKRRKYYATKGPDFIWVMDQVRVLSKPVYKRQRPDLLSFASCRLCADPQNEKIGMFGFKILCVMDGFSRYPVSWKVSNRRSEPG